MVGKEEIIKIARNERLPLGTIEKDFILTYILKKIYDSGLKDRLAFKGGTALHKLYLHKRMSIDLDFTELKPFSIDELKTIIENKEISSEIKEINKTDNSTKIVLSYFTILEYRNNIIIDISKREKPALELVIRKLKSHYFKEISVLTFQLEELIAEKIRAIIQRNKPRDYLDIYYILGNKDINWSEVIDLAKKKLKISKDKLSIERIFNNLDMVKSLWEQDLRELLPVMPDFDKVIRKLRNKFKNIEC